MSSPKLAAVCMLCHWLLLLPCVVFGQESLRGNLTIVNSRSVTSQPYPTRYGIRTTVERTHSLPSACVVCDKGAPTEQCFPALDLCVELSNTSVYIIHTNNGTLQSLPMALDSQCIPRYLQKLDSALAVVCRGRYYHVIHRDESRFRLDSVEFGDGQQVVLVGSVDSGHYLIEMAATHIYEWSISAGISKLITPESNCTKFISLHPLFKREHFMLLCNTSAGNTRLYIVNRFTGDTRSIPLSLPPISSPDGGTFLVWSSSALRIYNANNLMQYPGVKAFPVEIRLCIYLSPNTVLVVFERSNQIIIHVDTFINSAGEKGFISLSYTDQHSCVGRLIESDIYATSNRTDPFHNLLLFNVADGRALVPVRGLLQKPVDVFFQAIPSHNRTPSNPPSPSPSTTSTTTHLTPPTPPTPPAPAPAEHTTEMTPPYPTDPQTPSSPSSIETPTQQGISNTLKYTLIGVVLFVAAVICICICIIALVWCVCKRQRRRYCCKKICPSGRGPFAQVKGEASRPISPGVSRGSLDGESTAPSGSTCGSSMGSLGEGEGERHFPDSLTLPIPETINRQ